MVARILSPDGFDINPITTMYNSDKEIREAVASFVSRYEQQGYYSSNNGRISLQDLPDAMKVIKIEDGIAFVNDKMIAEVEVTQDTDPESPREWSNMTTMVCFHRKYNLGDKHNYSKDDYNSWQELAEAINYTPAMYDVKSTTEALLKLSEGVIKTPKDIPRSLYSELEQLKGSSLLLRGEGLTPETEEAHTQLLVAIRNIESIFKVVPYPAKTKALLSKIKAKVLDKDFAIQWYIIVLFELSFYEFSRGESWGVKHIAEQYHRVKKKRLAKTASELELVKSMESMLGAVAIIKPLYMYEHSGITISTSPFSCRWDSGQIGWVFITKETAKEEYGDNLTDKELAEKLNDILEAEVKTYDQYLTGDVYSFNIQTPDDNGDYEHYDSCSGFYGEESAYEAVLESLSLFINTSVCR
jgi:hypothetical protein